VRQSRDIDHAEFSEIMERLQLTNTIGGEQQNTGAPVIASKVPISAA
jgi:hypothetical protein